ncbi:hypothetical protein SDRG_11192 [Saprolegnia diclina VS20]|uniref:Uncharacterized protein n=1 Tax=Saprolegnia diclina (strain VS20) TaxID=1156394 RepID=T0QBV7_SAPDV|nr:hypothetical protein SDRG_11192 [Saprolegnia diclina VS20]EQC31005.1 hypothetical protein SDRG_11192 [Saprolegnia diclina VS20]|eukprot:XP_008615444.1 hypothetical protein SDRG_11192 [Saprolegnia diclina VS20]
MEKTRHDVDGHAPAEAPRDMHVFKLRCNACWEVLCGANGPQACYRTCCSHIFCERDAMKHFRDGNLICPACGEDLSQRQGSVCEITVKSATGPRRLEIIWEEMLADPVSCMAQIQEAMRFLMVFRQSVWAMFMLATLVPASPRKLPTSTCTKVSHGEALTTGKERIHNELIDEHKEYQQQHGQRYLQMKSYTEKLEEEIGELKNKMVVLNNTIEETRESYKDKARVCRNYEKVIKGMKAQQEGNGQRVMTAQPSGRMPLNVAPSPKFAKSISSMQSSSLRQHTFDQPATTQHPAFAMQNESTSSRYASNAMARPSSSFRGNSSFAPPPSNAGGMLTRSSKRLVPGLPPVANGDDDYDVGMDDPALAEVPVTFDKSAVESIIFDSGIVLQFAQHGVELEDTLFLQPDLCTLDDWHREVDERVQPNALEQLSDREIDDQITSLLTSMDPKEHYLNAAEYYLDHPKEYAAFFKTPLVVQSCHYLGIDSSAIPHRSLQSFKRQPDSAEAVPDLVLKARYDAYRHECQLCIAIILQTQQLIAAKLQHGQVDPLPPVVQAKRKKPRTRPVDEVQPPRVYDHAKNREELQRMDIMKHAKLLENAERWKETQASIHKASDRRVTAREAAELAFKQKEFEKEVKLKSYDAVAEQKTRRKMILDNFRNHTPVQLKPNMKEEARLVKELHNLDLDEHLRRAARIKHAHEYRKQHVLDKSNRKLERLPPRVGPGSISSGPPPSR